MLVQNGSLLDKDEGRTVELQFPEKRTGEFHNLTRSKALSHLEGSGRELESFILSHPSIKENKLQIFLEERPELVFRPTFRLNHGLHNNAIITKFSLGERITDFFYVTKSSVFAHAVFVEIEQPYEEILTESNGIVRPRAELTKAIAQVEDWQCLLEDRGHDVKHRIRRFLGVNANKLPLKFKYILVIGSDLGAKTRLDGKSLRYLANKQKDNFEICTFGSLCRNEYSCSSRPVVLKERCGKLEIMHLHSEPQFFYNLNRDDLAVTSEQVKKLKKWGYQIDEWLNGERLACNHKYVDMEAAAHFEGGRIKSFSQRSD